MFIGLISFGFASSLIQTIQFFLLMILNALIQESYENINTHYS